MNYRLWNGHIEFVGIPGSGKSSLYRLALKHVNSYGGVKALRLDDLMTYAYQKEHDGNTWIKSMLKKGFYFFGRRFIHSSYCSKQQARAFNRFLLSNEKLIGIINQILDAREISFVDRDRILWWLFNKFSAYQLYVERNKTDEILVLDEGFSHRAVSIWGRGANPISEAEIIAYIELIPRPNMVIVVEAKPKTCMSRMDIRGYPSIITDVPSAQRRQLLGRMEAIINVSVKKLKDSGVAVCHIDNNHSLNESSLLLQHYLDKMFKVHGEE